jgi:P-type E1-E2 ATPase
VTPSQEPGRTSQARAAPAKTAVEVLHSLGSDLHAGLGSAEAGARLAREGPNEVPEKRVHPFASFARKFWGLSAWMIELIAFLSFLLHKYADLTVALGLLLVNAVLSFLQEQRASAAVAALRRRLQVAARVLRDGAWHTLHARELVPGDIVRVRRGDFVPADVQLLDGELSIDQSALTGESQAQRKTTNAPLYSGSVVLQGEATAVVVATGVKTYFGRTTELVQSARPRLHVEEVVTRVVKWLFLIVGVQVAVALVVSLAEGLPLLEILPLTLVLLMSAVPVALPVMFTVSMAVGSVELARHGVLITQLSAAEDAANMTVLCADKTGTLTMNRLSLVGALPQAGCTEDDVVSTGALASQEADQDPIDLAFLRAAHDRRLLHGAAKLLAFVPFSPSTRRTEALVEMAGRPVHVMKGALRTVAEAAGLEESAVAALEARAAAEAQHGSRILAVARAAGDAPWRLVGLALLRDVPRPDSRLLIGELQSLGVHVKMLTGDALPVARAVAQELGLGEVVRAPDLRAAQNQAGTPGVPPALTAGGLAEVFPEDKFLVVKRL